MFSDIWEGWFLSLFHGMLAFVSSTLSAGSLDYADYMSVES